MDWITTANGLIALITALCGLIGTGVGAFIAVKNWIKVIKQKSAKEIWSMITEIADIAMREFEHSSLSGVEKKKAVIEAVKVSCKSAGLNIDLFIDQLSDYIDSSITWFNSMNK